MCFPGHFIHLLLILSLNDDTLTLSILSLLKEVLNVNGNPIIIRRIVTDSKPTVTSIQVIEGLNEFSPMTDDVID